MQRKARWAVLIGVFALLSALAFAFGGAWFGAGVLGSAGIAIGLSLLTARPAAVDFVLRNSRGLIIAGVAIAVIGCATSIALPFVVPNASDAMTTVSTVLFVGATFVGVFTAMTPSMVRQVQASKTEVAAIKREPVSSGARFDGIGEAVMAVRSVFEGWPVFLQVAGPWVAILCSGLFLLFEWGNNLGHDKAKAVIVLITAAALLLGLLYVVLPTITVAWLRWTIERRRPPYFLALPDRAALSLAWRFWTFLIATGALDRLMSPRIQALVGAGRAQLADEITWWLIMVVAVAVASSFALRFPAIATGDRSFSRAATLLQGRKLWPGLPIGLVLSLAPFLALAWALEYVFDPYVKPPLSMDPAFAVEVAVGLLAFFAAIASASTLLARAYLRAKSELRAA